MTRYTYPAIVHVQTYLDVPDLEMEDFPLLLAMNEDLPCEGQAQSRSFLSGSDCVFGVNGTICCPDRYTTCQGEASPCSRSHSRSSVPKVCRQGGSDNATLHNSATSPMDYDVTYAHSYRGQLTVASGTVDADTEYEFGYEQSLRAQYDWLERQYAVASEKLLATQRELTEQQVCVMEKTAELEDCIHHFQKPNPEPEESADRDMLISVQSADQAGIINRDYHTRDTAERERTPCRKRKHSVISDGQVERTCKRRRRT
jgi:hypothetical protein